jgi:hypothetical protein
MISLTGHCFGRREDPAVLHEDRLLARLGLEDHGEPVFEAARERREDLRLGLADVSVAWLDLRLLLS